MTRNPAQSDATAPPPAHKSLGRHLRMLRLEKGLTQGDIERKTGLLRGHVSRLEHGHIMPSLDTLQRYADAIEVPLYLIFYAGEPRSRRSHEISEATLQRVLDRHGQPASEPEEAFLRKLGRISARLTDADRELILNVARKVAGVDEE